MTYGDHLDQELRAAGLQIDGCSSDGRIDWVSPPAPAEQATAAAVLAAHDPDQRRREEEAEAAARRQLVVRLLADTVDEPAWQALTAQRRDEDTRLGLRMLALLARRVQP